MRALAIQAASGIAWGSVLIAAACDGDGSGAEEAPLGWGGPVEAREIRQWTKESMDSAARWVVGDEPTFVLVPDSTERMLYGGAEERIQRGVHEGLVLPDGRVVLLYGLAPPDSILLHIFDPGNGEEVLIPAPWLEDGLPPSWVHANMIALGGEIILRDNNEVPLIHRGAGDMLASGQGGFFGPPSYINVRGKLLGTFPDGSLVMMVESGSTDTTIVSAMMAVWPVEVGHDPPRTHSPAELLRTAAPRDPAKSRGTAGWAHLPRFNSAVAGDTIWIVPTERPVLLAVHRAGDILLKVEWEAGDRSIPAGAHEFWNGAERFPSAASLRIGTDGLVYVQRWSVREDQPERGPEWLVFSPSGELVANLDIPGRWPTTEVLAFGDGAAVVRTRAEQTGVQEIQVYAITKS